MQTIWITMYLVYPILAVLSGVVMGRIATKPRIGIASSLVLITSCYISSWLLGIEPAGLRTIGFYLIYLFLHCLSFYILYRIKGVKQRKYS